MPAIAPFVEQYRKRLLPLGLLFIMYCAAVAVTSHTLIAQSYPVILWPASGVALAGLVLYGRDLWPAVAVGTLVLSVLHGSPLLIIVGSTIGNTLQAYLSAYVLQQFEFNPMLARLRDPVLLIAVSLVYSTIAPTLTIATLWAELALPAFPLTLWLTWWSSQVLSTMVFGGCIMRWLRPFYHRTRMQWAEDIAVMGALVIIDFLLFWTPYAQTTSVPLVYLVLIPLIWTALRLGPRWMTFALFVTSLIALSGVASGHFGTASVAAELLNIKFFILVLSIIFLLFVASEESRKETAKALEEHVGQLENALQKISAEDKAKNEFIAILAHELRNPLAPIVSSLDLLRLGDPSTDVPTLVEAMYEHTSTMARLLDDLLDISRISQRKLKLQKEQVSLRSTMMRALQTVEPILQSRGHSVTKELPEEPLFIEADPVRIEQVLVNLLSNAAKYTPRGGKIDISAHTEGRTIAIVVRDNGIGIEPHMLGHIFEPFVQVERGKQSAGLGIGLSLTKRLVEMHRGTIEAKSDGLGRGSTFTVHLPLPESVQLPMPLLRASRAARRAARLATGTARTPAPKKPGAYRILVVDDNEAAAQGLSKLLTYRGHEVSVAYSGEAALEAAVRSNPDIVILDIGLPGMDGYEVARRMRAGVAKNSVLIALTGYGQEDDKKKASEAGFSYHLTKPVGLAEVEAVLAKI